MRNKIILLTIAMTLSVFIGCNSPETVGKETIQDNEVSLEDKTINNESQDVDNETTENENNDDVANENEENNNSNTVIPDTENENFGDVNNDVESNDSLGYEAPTNNDEVLNTDDSNVQELLNGELTAIIEKIYEIRDPGLMVGNNMVDLSNMDSVKYYTGLNDVSKIKEALVSESMIGSQAYSLVLVRVTDSADSEFVANEMLNGINSSKWICVQADDLQVVTHDDLILLIMVSSNFEDTITSQQIVDAFKEIWEMN